MRLSLSVFAVLFVACPQSTLEPVTSAAVRAPALVDFGVVYVGSRATAALHLDNPSRVAVEVTLAWPAPFGGPASVVVPAGEGLDVEAFIDPRTPGTVREALPVGDGTVELRAQVEAPLSCPGAPCEVTRFDPTVGRCVHEAAADETACSTPCVTEGRCRAGVCVGAASSCDDGNACTVDACDATTGQCRHPLDACDVPPLDCQVPYCDPVLGCAAVDAMDGVRCGPDDCANRTTRVCIAGACATRPRNSTEWCVAVHEGVAGGFAAVDGVGAHARVLIGDVLLDERGVVTTLSLNTHDAARVRRVSRAGVVVTTVKGPLVLDGGAGLDGLGRASFWPLWFADSAAAVDAAGTVWFLERRVDDLCVRNVSPAGLVRTTECLPTLGAGCRTLALGPSGLWLYRNGVIELRDGGAVVWSVDASGITQLSRLEEVPGRGLLVSTVSGVFLVSLDGGTSLERPAAQRESVADVAASGDWVFEGLRDGGCVVTRCSLDGGCADLAATPPSACGDALTRPRLNARGDVVRMGVATIDDLRDGGWVPRAGVRSGSDFDGFDELTSGPCVFGARGRCAGVATRGFQGHVLHARAADAGLDLLVIDGQLGDGGMRLEHLRLDGDGGWAALQATTMSNDGWWYSRRVASLVENSSVAWMGTALSLRRFDFTSGAMLDFPVWNLAWVGAVTPDLVDCATPTSLCRFSVDGGLQHLVGDPVLPGFVDGPAATARFAVITDVAVARDGTRYVADSTNLAIRLVTPTGAVSTIARLSDAPRAIALDESGPRPRLWVLVTDALLVAEPP